MEISPLLFMRSLPGRAAVAAQPTNTYFSSRSMASRTREWGRAALCWFVETGDMVGWVLAAVLLREFAVSGMRLIAVEKGRVIAAGWSGKVKTASTMVCICLMLFGIPHWLNLVCQGVILVTTVYSGVEYFVKNWDVFSEK